MTPQPGWFADPWRAAQLRWWDGGAWTAHTAARPSSGGPDSATAANSKATFRVRALLILVTVSEVWLVPMTVIFLMFLPAHCRTATCSAARAPLGVAIWFGVPGLLLAAWVGLDNQRVPARWTVCLALASALLCAAVLGSDIWLTNSS
jgi:Protein of unknown function (DUF2510)